MVFEGRRCEGMESGAEEEGKVEDKSTRKVGMWWLGGRLEESKRAAEWFSLS